MLLNIDKAIDLTRYMFNPAPKIVSQLAIVHEAKDGELVQYYINQSTLSEGDKSTTALSKRHKQSETEYYYTYTDYDTVFWGYPKARITRRRIDRLGLKAFPNVGSIAHYKLAYQNHSKILAPVNYRAEKLTSPTLHAVVNADQTITFTIISPTDITYNTYRVIMQLGLNQLEYVSYTNSFTVPAVLTSGTYTCYAIGYVGEGERSSVDSNEIELTLVGPYDEWPAVTPGAEDATTLAGLNDVRLTYLQDEQMLRYEAETEKWKNISLASLDNEDF